MMNKCVLIGLSVILGLCSQSAGSENWESLLRTADSLFEADNLDSALAVGKLALQKAEEELGPEDTVVARVMHRLGTYDLSTYFLPELTPVVETRMKRALAIREKAFGEQHLDVVASLHQLGTLYQNFWRCEEAKPLLYRALAILQNILGPHHPKTVSALRKLGIFHFRQDQFVEALSFFERALAAAQASPGSDDLDVARIKYYLGRTYFEQGKDRQAESLFDQSLAVRVKVLGADHPDVAACLRQIGHVCAIQGKYDKADSLYRESLIITEKAFGPDHKDVVASLMNLADVNLTMGRNREAEALYRRSVETAEKSLGAKHSYTGQSLRGLAEVCLEQGRYLEAESLGLRSLDIMQDVWGADHSYVTMNLDQLARIYANLSRFAEAEEMCRRSLAAWMKVYTVCNSCVARGLHILASIFERQGMYTQAESLYVQSLGMREETLGPDHPAVAASLESTSKMSRLRGDPWEAASRAARSCDIRRKSFTENSRVLSERDALTFSQFMRGAVDNFLSCYLELEPTDTATTWNALDIVFCTKGQVSDEIFNRQQALVDETDSATLALAESLRLAKFLAAKLFVQEPDEDVQKHRKTLDSLRESADSLEADLTRRSASFRKRQDRKNVTSSRLAVLLPEKSVLVEYLKYNYKQLDPDSIVPRYMAVVMANEWEPSITDLGDAAEIDSLVGRYRRHMLHVSAYRKTLNRDQEEYLKLCGELYDRVWKPIEDHVAGQELVFVAPDGALNMISFAGLTDSSGKYLVEESAIHYLSCGRDLIRLQDEPELAGGLFALGDPDYDAAVSARLSHLMAADDTVPEPTYYVTRNVRSGCDRLKETLLSPLPASRHEVELVVAGWQASTGEPVTPRLGAEASEDIFKAEAPGNSVIHLATHGYFLHSDCRAAQLSGLRDGDAHYIGENPLLLSGLFLAGANLHGQGTDSAAEDGVLTAYEVSAMDLSGTELVVLSACETGLGEVREGEGVYGLRRAFQMAGARTVISALWPVSDEAAAEIVGRVHERTTETLPEQLRALQLERIKALRKQGQPDHPVSWAGFIAMGDWH